MTEELEWNKVTDLGPSSRSVNLKVQAISRNEVREVSSRRDGQTHRVTEILVGDESAVVYMTVWDDMIEQIEDGKSYVLKNGYTSLFKGNIRLNIGRYGEIEESEETVEKVNDEENISDKTYDQPPRYRRSYGGRGGYGGGSSSGYRASGVRDRRRRY